MVKSRNTRQKEVMLEEIQKFNTFFNAEELLEIVQKKEKKVGIATIYRFLKNLKEKNQIYSFQCGGKTIYSNSQKSHCHFHCTKTGKTFHFEIDNLDFLKDKIPGKIESVQIEINGICEHHITNLNNSNEKLDDKKNNCKCSHTS